MRCAVIVNPRSANGKTGRDWPKIEGAVREACNPERVVHTEHPGHATTLTREMLREGFELIVSAGGDGTHHEVVNGFFERDTMIRPEATMAILPQGTGSDLARSLQFTTIQEALAALVRGRVCHVDVGRAHFLNHRDEHVSEYFLNCAHIGFGGHVADRVNRTSKALGGFLSFLIGVLKSLVTYRSPVMTARVDGNYVHGRINDIVIANAQWDGGGMFIAPNAALDSGSFEVYVIEDISRLDAVRNLHKIYKGRLMDRPDIVQYFQARRIDATSPERVLINLEGEQPGRLPATFEVLPAALRLITGNPSHGGVTANE